MTFWDASAFVMAYVPLERDHARAASLLRSEPRHAGTVLLRPEATSALVRRHGRDVVTRDRVLALMDVHLKDFDLYPVDDGLLDRAVVLIRRRALRSADAIHLAGAVRIARDLPRAPIRFVTADTEQARPARAAGLRLIRLRP